MAPLHLAQTNAPPSCSRAHPSRPSSCCMSCEIFPISHPNASARGLSSNPGVGNFLTGPALLAPFFLSCSLSRVVRGCCTAGARAIPWSKLRALFLTARRRRVSDIHAVSAGVTSRAADSPAGKLALAREMQGLACTSMMPRIWAMMKTLFTSPWTQYCTEGASDQLETTRLLAKMYISICHLTRSRFDLRASLPSGDICSRPRAFQSSGLTLQ